MNRFWKTILKLLLARQQYYSADLFHPCKSTDSKAPNPLYSYETIYDPTPLYLAEKISRSCSIRMSMFFENLIAENYLYCFSFFLFFVGALVQKKFSSNLSFQKVFCAFLKRVGVGRGERGRLGKGMIINIIYFPTRLTKSFYENSLF